MYTFWKHFEDMFVQSGRKQLKLMLFSEKMIKLGRKTSLKQNLIIFLLLSKESIYYFQTSTSFLTLIRLGFFKVVFPWGVGVWGGVNLTPFIFQEELI